MLTLRWTIRSTSNRQSKFYEFPDGYNHYYGMERYQLPEMLFRPEAFIDKVSFIT